MNLRRAKIIGFISVKGGVGKTTTVANLGAILAKEYSKKVLIVDGNFSGPNLALHYGFTKIEHTLHDVFEGKVTLQKAIYEHPSGLHLLPLSYYSRKVDYNKFYQYIASLKGYYDVILIDSSPSMNSEIIATLMASDEVFILSTPDHVALASTLAAVRLAKQKRTYIAGIILNKVRGKKYELKVEDIQDAVKIPVVSVLKEDPNMLMALSKSKPLSLLKPRNDAVVEYKKLAAALIGERYKDKRIITKLKGMFGKKLSQEDVNRAIIMVSHY